MYYVFHITLVPRLTKRPCLRHSFSLATTTTSRSRAEAVLSSAKRKKRAADRLDEVVQRASKLRGMSLIADVKTLEVASAVMREHTRSVEREKQNAALKARIAAKKETDAKLSATDVEDRGRIGGITNYEGGGERLSAVRRDDAVESAMRKHQRIVEKEKQAAALAARCVRQLILIWIYIYMYFLPVRDVLTVSVTVLNVH